MPLNFKPSSHQNPVQETAPVVVQQPEPQPQFSIVEKTEELKKELVRNDEIDRLVSKIDINDMNSIVKFGSEAAEEISKASDQVLRSMNMSQINDSGALLKSLANIMDQFDIKEFEEEDKGFFSKLFGNAKKKIDELLAKYDNMGKDVDKIYVQLKQYETEIGQSNQKLEMLYNSNIHYYQELLKYIMAGEQAVSELDGYIADYQKQLEVNPEDGQLRMDLQNLMQVREIFDQRVMDLKIAENVAMQTVPMLKTMEFSNVNLIRKINSAFIVTMPIFKQSLAQAVMLKRQKVQAEALSALDEKTNEMLLKNAQNTVAISKQTAAMASGSSIKVETLEQTWQTIVSGIEETKQIQTQARAQREQDAVRLQKLQEDYKRKAIGQ